MSELKRFWKTAEAALGADGWTVLLDGRSLKTPAKAGFIAPNRAVAEAAAKEWRDSPERVNPANMPITRTVNSAIDRVRANRAEVNAMVAEYGGSDLLCYRAGSPQALNDRQSAAWDPVLDWLSDRYGARLAAVEGVMHVAQPPAALAALAQAVAAVDDFTLTALHDVVTISGSLGIGLAALERRLSAEAAWAACRIDEDWQREQWGEDDEAAAQAARRHRDFMAASRFLDLLRQAG